MRQKYFPLILMVLTICALFILSCEKLDDKDPLEMPGVPVLDSYSYGDSCIPGTEVRAKETEDDTLVEVSVDGYMIKVEHQRMFNCAKDSITVEFSFSGDTLTLLEVEHTSNPVRCDCLFDVESNIEVQENGDYAVKLWVVPANCFPPETTLVWEDVVTVSECP
ncbi:hypothetical protein JXI42_12040 [bacterium]|nr:hypothetical protein [bacterium]